MGLGLGKLVKSVVNKVTSPILSKVTKAMPSNSPLISSAQKIQSKIVEDSPKGALKSLAIVATAGAGALAGGGSVLASRLIKNTSSLSASSSTVKNTVSSIGSKLIDKVKNPTVSKLISTAKDNSKLIGGFLQQQFKPATYKPSVLDSPLVDQFTETKTGLQQSVFGSPVSDSYKTPLSVSWDSKGLDDFNISGGDVEISKGKKQTIPVWGWVVGSIIAFFGMLALIGKLKFK